MQTDIQEAALRQPRVPFADIRAMSFETALKELEQSIDIYERGEALRSHCDQLLKRAEAKVERITLSAQGVPSGAVPLDAEV